MNEIVYTTGTYLENDISRITFEIEFFFELWIHRISIAWNGVKCASPVQKYRFGDNQHKPDSWPYPSPHSQPPKVSIRSLFSTILIPSFFSLCSSFLPLLRRPKILLESSELVLRLSPLHESSNSTVILAAGNSALIYTYYRKWKSLQLHVLP